MALRTVALCDGKYIGIESIFTVIDGKQINIPEKLKELRSKSQSDRLFCPCGCGANYILVAGDRNLREQHFRIKDGQNYENCSVVTEGRTSVESKIVLKCWLDDNLHADDLESRVPICSLSDSNRKYEFTFISRSCGIALDYCHNRLNLSEEKQAVLEENCNGINIIHVVDIMNGGSNGQYPECLMKVQEKQKYCLLLSVEDSDYDTAEMKAVFYEKDLDGLWPETVFAEGMLKEYQIDRSGRILFKGASLDELYTGAKQKFLNSMVSEKERREKAEKQREEQIKQIRAEAERKKEERRLWDEDFTKNLESNLEQQEKRVIDANGIRWIKCEFCGKIAKEAEFYTYGGRGHINLGTCKECKANNPSVKMARENRINEDKKKYDSSICPDCGGRLKEIKWRNGTFIGCSHYPDCKYTRSNW